MRGEVVARDGRAECAQPCHEPFGEFTHGERVSAFARSDCERTRQGRLPEEGVFRRHPVGVEDLREPGMRGVARRALLREIVGDGSSLGGIDRGPERLGPRPDGALAVHGYHPGPRREP